MKIRRLNESDENNWYYEIRDVDSGFNGDYTIVDLDNYDFGDFDWDKFNWDENMQNLKLLANLKQYLENENPSRTYQLVKMTTNVIKDSEIDMILTSDKYNL